MELVVRNAIIRKGMKRDRFQPLIGKFRGSIRGGKRWYPPGKKDNSLDRFPIGRKNRSKSEDRGEGGGEEEV